MKTTITLKLLLLLFTASCLFNNAAISQVLAAGQYHSLYICPNSNSAWAWGYGQYGQIGNGSTQISIATPTQVLDTSWVGNNNCCLTNITAIAGGGYHSMALSSDSTVYMWGDNSDLELGNASNTNSALPVSVLNSNDDSVLTSIVAIATGDHHALAVDKNGVVWGWGRDIAGQLGQGANYSSQSLPVKVTTLSPFYIVAVSCGSEHSLAIDSSGNVYAFGEGYEGQLGDGSIMGNNGTYVIPYNVAPITAVAAGGSHTLVLKRDSTVWAFGDNADGDLGDNTIAQRNLPVPVHGPGNVDTLKHIIAIAAAGNHSAALRVDGTVWCWGDNTDGDVGDCHVNTIKYPSQVDSLSNITNIALGLYFGLAMDNNGVVYCWGDNEHGQLGIGNQANQECPMKVKYLCSSLSVPQLSLDESVSVYPNPFSSSTTITFGDVQIHTTVTLTDVLGKEINSYTIHGASTLTIDKGNLNSGIYFVKIIDASKNVLNKKLIIQ